MSPRSLALVALLALGCAQPAANDEASASSALFGPLGCAAGILRECPTPVCEAPAYPALGTTCADYVGVEGCGGCEYYACKEAELGCGEGGYFLGFAKKYCDRFLLTVAPRMSPEGRAFLDEARDCLMFYVEDDLANATSCEEVHDRALASHVACYRDSGFCSLSFHDKLRLLSAIDPEDYDLVTMLETELDCL